VLEDVFDVLEVFVGIEAELLVAVDEAVDEVVEEVISEDSDGAEEVSPDVAGVELFRHKLCPNSFINFVICFNLLALIPSNRNGLHGTRRIASLCAVVTKEEVSTAETVSSVRLSYCLPSA
jgi:hypothetical protein